jgi:hypothetical protein
VLAARSRLKIEVFNSQLKLSYRKAFGIRTPQGIETLIGHMLGPLPDSPLNRRLCGKRLNRGCFERNCKH